VTLTELDLDTTGRHARITECPACGEEFSELTGREISNHLLHDHTPADFGLSPLSDGESDA